MMRFCVLLVTLFASASAFSSPSVRHRRRATPLRLFADGEISRGALLSSARSAILASVLMPSVSIAEETQPEKKPETQPETQPETTPKPSRSIQGCAIDSDDCVSTANIKDAKGSYSPPWTFEVSPDEAFARIKGVLKSDDSYVVTELDDEGRYIRAYAKRFTMDAQDEVEFLVKGEDKVVLFKSRARKNGSVSDFGANGRRIDDIRKKGAVFDMMGGGMTADSFQGGGAMVKGNNPFGQIKSFYGLQSGQGLDAGTRIPAFNEDE